MSLTAAPPLSPPPASSHVCAQVVHSKFLFDDTLYANTFTPAHALMFIFLCATTRYLSCEQAYQAAKFAKASPSRVLIDAAVPLQGESDKDFGIRCWALGQAQANKREDWDSAKVKVMLSINRAKCPAPNSQTEHRY